MKQISGSYVSIASQLSLKKDDILFIASDIKQLALDCRKEGESFDVSRFIESFQEVLAEGTLIIPAYTDLLKNGETFDHAKSKPTTGALSNKVQRRKDFIRTKDPLHSVFVWGKHQDALENMDSSSTLGEGSIFDFLYNNGGKMICIDVDFQNSLTFVHYVEEKLKVAYRKPYKWKLNRVIKGEEGTKEITFYTKKPWVLTDLAELQRKSTEDGVNMLYVLNDSVIQSFDLIEMQNYIEEFIKAGGKLYKVSILHCLKSTVKKVLGR